MRYSDVMFDEKEYRKQYHKNNRKKLIEKAKKWQKDNPEKANEGSRRWCKNNPGYDKQYRKNNLEKERKYDRQYAKNRWKADLRFNLNSKISSAIYLSLRGNKNGRHWEILVGYTLDDLIRRLKKTTPKGYTWNDYLNGKLHIDHSIPISVFNFTKPEHIDFKRCWTLKNLRLLPAKENLIKNAKLFRPFQLTLKI